METKRIEDYFKKTRQLPLALSFNQVESLVSIKGVISPPKKSWWNLNNIIIMTTSTIIISLALSYFVNSPQTVKEQNIVQPEIENNVLIDSVQSLSKEEVISKEIFPIVEEKIEITPLEEKQNLIEEKAPTLLINERLAQQPLPDSGKKSNEIAFLPETDDSYLEDSAKIAEILDVKEVEEEEILEEEEAEVAEIVDGESRVVTKKITAEGIEWFKLHNKRGNVNVTNWNSNEIEVTATFTLKAKDDIDAKKGLEDFELMLNQGGNQVIVETNWDNVDHCDCGPGKKKNKIKTDQGEKIEIEKFSITYDVKLPNKMNLHLDNKYANIRVGNVDGQLEVTLFKGDLNAGNIKGNLDLSLKYGDVTTGNFNRGEIVLFKSKAILGNSEGLELSANYSSVKMGGTDKLDLTAFKTDVEVNEKVGTLEGNFKYGDLEFKSDVNQMELIAFKSDIQGKNFDKIDMNASYCEFEAIEIKQLELENAFKTDFKVNRIGTVEGNLKYSPLKVEILDNSMELSMFKGKLEIDNVKASFKELDLVTKYTDVELKFDPNSKYELDAETSYTNFKIPSEVMNLELKNGGNNNSNHFKGAVNQQSTKETSKVTVNAFQGNLSLQ